MLEVENRDDYFRNQLSMRAMNPALSMRPNTLRLHTLTTNYSSSITISVGYTVLKTYLK